MTSHFDAARPQHHVPEWLLWSYAQGGVSEGESLLVACHAALCPECHAAIQALEGVGGALLSAAPAEAVSDDLWTRTLARLEQEVFESKPSVPRRAPDDAVLPRPLAELIGAYEEIPWKRAFEGLYYYDLPLLHGDVPVRLRRLPPGMTIPRHSHRGAEHELVLAGGAVDLRDGRRYLRGDVASNDERDTHSVQVDPDGECLVLGVHDHRIAPRGLWSRLVFGFLGW